MDKAGVKILFFGRSNLGKEKEKPWSRGTNSRLPPNLSNDQPANADRVFRKIRLRSQANIDQYYPKNAFIGVTSFNICTLQKKRKRNNENRGSSSFQ